MSTSRRAFVALMFALVVTREASGGFVRGTRAGSPPPPPAPEGLPDSPTMLEATGSLVGQATILFNKGVFLQGFNNDPITDAPITGTVIRASTSWANAEAGIYAYSVDCGTAEQGTIPSIPAGTWYMTTVSTNANGTSDISHVLTVVVT